MALFIPFSGCPHRCSFCDQRSITGRSVQPTPQDVRETIENAVSSLKENTYTAEIAFFGGSFTAIDRVYMRSLLDAAAPYLHRFRGIRISTRPDAVDDEVLTLLKDYHVTSIELGAQSMSDAVLTANERGHSADDVRRAAQLIQRYDMELGLQMMTGLYQSTDALDRYTAEEFIRLHPATVRIYPTIVMRNTRLGELYEAGEYLPQTLDSAVALCADLLTLFEENGIRVIRVGLHDTPTLRRDMLAGPYHPAFRELCESRLMLRRAIALLENKPHGEYMLAVNPKSRSKMTGCKKSNLTALSRMGYSVQLVEDASIPDLSVIFSPS